MYWNVLGVQYLLASALLLVAGGTWTVRWWRAKPGRDETRELPRLLVGCWIQASLIVLCLGGFAYSLIIDPKLEGLDGFGGKDVIVVLAPVFAFLATVIPASGLRSGFHIVADVINHFHRVPARFPRPWDNDPNPKAAGPDSESEFLIRKRIEGRVMAVLAEVLKTYRPRLLLLLAHSQGTVAVTGVLRQEETQKLLQEVQDVRLSTMGSPLTHLYQHYFPNQYPPFKEAYWKILHDLVPCGRWLNLYRFDDFVGTRVDGTKPDWPVNQCVSTTGGHVNYWRQVSVVQALNVFFFAGVTVPGAAVTDPGWLKQHGGRLSPSKDGRSWLVYLGDEPQYLLMPTPVKGKFGCRISQTISSRRLDGDVVYPSIEDAVRGGLDDLREELGW
jgi:hypothetical protein